jgi:glycosyltransferase involved in cell wall biosynthesis
LGEAIESVLNQSYPHFEIIVVDDGSKDNTSEVAARYPGVRLIRQENQGLSGARNAGIRHSEGEYVVFLDADDRLLPGALEAGLECFEANPECAFVSGYCNNIATDGSPLSPPPRYLHVGGDPYLALLRANYIMMPAMVVYRRSVFESVGGFDTSLKAAEDYDMYLRIARRFPVRSHERVVAEYRRHDTSMSRNPALMLSTSVAVLRSQRKHLRGHKRYKEAYKYGIWRRQGNYGFLLVDEVRAHVKEHEWKRALRGALVLLRYYPRGLALVLLSERHLERRKLARNLHRSRQELEFLEPWLREPESTLAEEQHQNVLWLTQRIQKLERGIQNLDQRG